MSLDLEIETNPARQRQFVSHPRPPSHSSLPVRILLPQSVAGRVEGRPGALVDVAWVLGVNIGRLDVKIVSTVNEDDDERSGDDEG